MNEAQKLLDRMSAGELEFLILRLGRYAERECKRLDWRTNNRKELPDGETDGSIVSKAFERVLSGRRNWDPLEDPDFAKYMMDVIDSLLSHLVNSKDNTMFGPPPEEGGTDETAWHGVTPVHGRKFEQGADWMVRAIASPEEDLLQKEQLAANKRALELLLASINNDAELVKIVRAIKEGCDKNGEIAKQTGIDIQNVEKAKKRLNRKIAGVNKQLMNSKDNEFDSKKRSKDNGRK